MELLGTTFSLTLGSWRLKIAFNVEEVREPAPPPPLRIHHAAPSRDYSQAR